jgi:nucleoside phosphorylase
MDTADILFIAAEPREFDGARRHWSSVKMLSLPVHWSCTATWKSKKIVAIANGAGSRRAAMAESVAPYRVLCNIGFCGALDGALHVGDIVVADGWLTPRSTGRCVMGRIASIDHIAQTVEEKQRLRAAGAIAVEMESAGLENVPGYCIKSVSDLADETFANDFNAVLKPDGRISIPHVLMNACLRPFSRFPELMRLRKRSKIAADSLGDFLESCEF